MFGKRKIVIYRPAQTHWHHSCCLGTRRSDISVEKFPFLYYYPKSDLS